MRITEDILRAVMPHARERVLLAELPLLNHTAFHYQINNRRRLAAWLATLAQESGEFRYQEELASGAAYEGRHDLGNTHPGDGVKFKGHGRIQGTGRDVHQAYTNYLKTSRHLPFVDFIAEPKRLATEPYSTDFAGWFVNGYKHLNDEADAGNFLRYSIGVNGRGHNGMPNAWPERQAYYSKALRAIPNGWMLDEDRPELTDAHIDKAATEASNASQTDEGRVTPTPEAENASEGLGLPANGISEGDTTTEKPVVEPPVVESGAAEGASSADSSLSPQVIDKERPSTFSKIMSGIFGFFGMVLAALTSFCSHEPVQTLATKGAENIADGASRSDLMHFAMFLMYLVAGVGGGVLLMFVGFKWYDNSAHRANNLNAQKIDAAANKDKNTVELK